MVDDRTKELINRGLRHPMILVHFLETTENLGFIGEELNKIIILFAFISRTMQKPIGVIIKGPSSSGKSALVEVIMKLFPENVYLYLSDISEAAFKASGDLPGKVLIISEVHGLEKIEYLLRVVQSEGKLTSRKMVTTGKNDWELSDFKIEGSCALIVTTTEDSIHYENETRNIEIYMDVSGDQTAAVHRMILEESADSREDNITLVKNWQIFFQALYENIPVIIPYAKLIEFPSDRERTRRDITKFLNLVKLSAMFHQFQRPIVRIRGQLFIVADIRDYGIAYRLWEHCYTSTRQGINLRVKELVDTLFQLNEDNSQYNTQKITVKDLIGRLGWDRTTISKHADTAENAGFIEIIRQGSGRPTFYQPIKKYNENVIGLLTPEELAERIKTEWLT